MRKGLSIIVGIAVLLFAYSASAAVETDGLVSWWKFDETSGTNAADFYEGPHYNTGTLYNFSTPGWWTTNRAGSASSRALDFPGSIEYVDCGSDTSLDLATGFTIEAWINLRAVESQFLFDSRTESYDGIQIYFRDNGDVEVSINNAIAGEAAGLMVGKTNEWHHIVATYTSGGSGANVYLDTNDVTRSASRVDWGDAAGTSRINTIGARYTHNLCFNGIMDDFRIYNRALTPDEIQDNYNAIPEPSTLLFMGAGLLCLLAFRRIGKRA